MFFFFKLYRTLKKNYIGVQLIYNVVLVSSEQQSDSVFMYTYIYSFSYSYPIQIITGN